MEIAKIFGLATPGDTTTSGAPRSRAFCANVGFHAACIEGARIRWEKAFEARFSRADRRIDSDCLLGRIQVRCCSMLFDPSVFRVP